MTEEKYICPFCGFESSGAGLCPSCDENLQRVCFCGSGKFSIDCCDAATAEEKKSEELIKAEVAGEALTEIAKEDEKKIKEEEELAKVEEIKEED